MSSSLNSRTADRAAPGGYRAEACGRPEKTAKNGMPSARRRRLLLALSGAPFMPLAALAGNDWASGLQRWGSGEFRRFGFLVYEATLWAGDDPQRPPLALRLDYRRTIAGTTIAEASVKEMRKFGSDNATLQRWGEQMAQLFPDVQPGDHIVGLYRPEGARFIFNGRPLGHIDDAAFARQFFGIWLDPRTSAPELRDALLRRRGG